MLFHLAICRKKRETQRGRELLSVRSTVLEPVSQVSLEPPCRLIGGCIGEAFNKSDISGKLGIPLHLHGMDLNSKNRIVRTQ